MCMNTFDPVFVLLPHRNDRKFKLVNPILVFENLSTLEKEQFKDIDESLRLPWHP